MTPHPVLSELERQVRRQALRYHVGQQIFCPTCNTVLDVSRAVEIDYSNMAGLVHSAIRCASCFDAGKCPERDGLTREITDGRVLFPPPAPRAPRTPSVKRPDPVPGRTYLVKHSGGVRRFRYERKVDRSWNGGRAVWHFVGTNLTTGRQIELKSRGKFLKEVSE